MEALRTMVFPRESKNTGQAGARPPAAGRGLAAHCHPRITAAVSVVCVFAVFGATNVSAPAQATTTSAHATALADAHAVASRNRSGLRWASGVYPRTAPPARAAAFAAWRGRPLDVVDAWLNRSTWAQIADPAWLVQAVAGTAVHDGLRVADDPEGVPGVSFRRAQTGLTTAIGSGSARVISSYGFGHSIIRLGWEFNGTWYSGRPPILGVGELLAADRDLRPATAPGLRWDWNVNRGVSGGLRIQPGPIRGTTT